MQHPPWIFWLSHLRNWEDVYNSKNYENYNEMTACDMLTASSSFKMSFSASKNVDKQPTMTMLARKLHILKGKCKGYWKGGWAEIQRSLIEAIIQRSKKESCCYWDFPFPNGRKSKSRKRQIYPDSQPKNKPLGSWRWRPAHMDSLSPTHSIPHTHMNSNTQGFAIKHPIKHSRWCGVMVAFTTVDECRSRDFCRFCVGIFFRAFSSGLSLMRLKCAVKTEFRIVKSGH